MSTAYDLECADHLDADTYVDEYSEWTNLYDSLVEMWQHRAELPAANDGPFEITVEWKGYRTISLRQQRWLRTHTDCHVQVVDENGRRFEISGDPVPAKHDCPSCRCRP